MVSRSTYLPKKKAKKLPITAPKNTAITPIGRASQNSFIAELKQNPEAFIIDTIDGNLFIVKENMKEFT